MIDSRWKSMTAYLKRNGNVLRFAIKREYCSEALEIALPLSEIFEQA